MTGAPRQGGSESKGGAVPEPVQLAQQRGPGGVGPRAGRGHTASGTETRGTEIQGWCRVLSLGKQVDPR